MAEKQDDQKKAKRPTALKRQLQNERRRMANKSFRSTVRTAFKGFLAAIGQQDKEKQMASFSHVASLLDKGVNRGVFKRNKASRLKARMSARLAKTS